MVVGVLPPKISVFKILVGEHITIWTMKEFGLDLLNPCFPALIKFKIIYVLLWGDDLFLALQPLSPQPERYMSVATLLLFPEQIFNFSSSINSDLCNSVISHHFNWIESFLLWKKVPFRHLLPKKCPFMNQATPKHFCLDLFKPKIKLLCFLLMFMILISHYRLFYSYHTNRSALLFYLLFL